MNFRTIANRLGNLNERVIDVAEGFDSGSMTYSRAAERLEEVSFKISDLMTPFMHDFPKLPATKRVRAALMIIDRVLEQVDEGTISPVTAYDNLEDAIESLQRADDMIFDYIPRKK